jgi:beta-1,4-mannosyl-glycoprotein beta-1,4-N-acetylglucosaminyltransferase
MKIYDCFMYFDEEVVLDLRLNTLNEYVDYFIIVESSFNHKGGKRKLKFNHKRFEKFAKKIIYLVYDKVPQKIKPINPQDTKDEKSIKYIYNAYLRENSQRNYIVKGLDHADQNDIILISDVDEIPNLEKINFDKISEKLIFFNQDMFYYKFNFKLPNLIWTGTKACKKKNLLSPQWLRNIKDKKYPFYRIDTLFSNTKYNNIKFIVEGGWHFTNIKTAKEIRNKLKSYLHHREFDLDPISTEDINEIINKKIAIYDLKVDKRSNKFGNGKKLENININSLPNYLQKNIEKYKEWID